MYARLLGCIYACTRAIYVRKWAHACMRPCMCACLRVLCNVLGGGACVYVTVACVHAGVHRRCSFVFLIHACAELRFVCFMCVCVWLNACMHVFIYLCLYVCMHGCMHACMHACMRCLRSRVVLCLHACMNASIYLCVRDVRDVMQCNISGHACIQLCMGCMCACMFVGIGLHVFVHLMHACCDSRMRAYMHVMSVCMHACVQVGIYVIWCGLVCSHGSCILVNAQVDGHVCLHCVACVCSCGCMSCIYVCVPYVV